MLTLLNDNMPKTIAGQLILWITATIMLAQILIIGLLFYATGAHLDDQEDRYILSKIASVYNKLGQFPSETDSDILEIASDPEFIFSLTPDPKAEKLVAPDLFSPAFQERFGDIPLRVSQDDVSFTQAIDLFLSDIDTVCAIEGPDPTKCPRHILSLSLTESRWLNVEMIILPYEIFFLLLPLIISALASLVGIIIVVILSVRNVTAPLRILADATDKLGKGEKIDHLATTGPQELSRTLDAFNMMQQRLSRFIEDRTHMLAAISHDLRTPITSLRLRAEFIDDPTLQQKMITTLEEMQIMVEACLRFAKQDIETEQRHRIDLIALLQDLADDFPDIRFDSPHRRFDYQCDPVTLKRALRNILENAITYGDRAEMNCQIYQDQIIILITDQGPGVPEDHLTAIFDPFIRLDQARNIESGHVGLGLSIARTLIRRYGGDIVANNTHPGLEMRITLAL